VIARSPGRQKDNHAGAERPLRAPLTLALLLMIAEPLGIALYASTILPNVIERGVWAVLLISVRLAITGVGIGAGLALWHQRPGAIAFARIAVALAAAGVTLTFLAPELPHNTPPGTTAPLLAVLLIYYAGWFVYLLTLTSRS
jgi:hypothetical protein